MEVLKNLLGNNTKINAKEIAALFDGNPQTLDVILQFLKIKSGSNANGSWIEFPNGELYCWKNDLVLKNVVGGANARINDTWTYPKQFKKPPVGLINVTGVEGAPSLESITHMRLGTSDYYGTATIARNNGETSFSFPTGSTATVKVSAIGEVL